MFELEEERQMHPAGMNLLQQKPCFPQIIRACRVMWSDQKKINK